MTRKTTKTVFHFFCGLLICILYNYILCSFRLPFILSIIPQLPMIFLVRYFLKNMPRIRQYVFLLPFILISGFFILLFKKFPSPSFYLTVVLQTILLLVWGILCIEKKVTFQTHSLIFLFFFAFLYAAHFCFVRNHYDQKAEALINRLAGTDPPSLLMASDVDAFCKEADSVFYASGRNYGFSGLAWRYLYHRETYSDQYQHLLTDLKAEGKNHLKKLLEHLCAQSIASHDPAYQTEAFPKVSDASAGNTPLTAEALRKQVEIELDRICLEKYSNLDAFFEAYSGEKLQVIDAGSLVPAANDSICFYRKDEEESVQDAVHVMFCALMDTFTEPSDDRPFTVLKYRIPEQTILSSREVTDRILNYADQIWETGLKDPYYGITGAYESEGLFPITDGMYEIIGFHGYYAFEGIEFIPFQDALEEAIQEGTVTDDGMIPFIAQGSAGTATYILLERNGVYRLQRAAVFAEMGFYKQKNRIIFTSKNAARIRTLFCAY